MANLMTITLGGTVHVVRSTMDWPLVATECGRVADTGKIAPAYDTVTCQPCAEAVDARTADFGFFDNV